MKKTQVVNDGVNISYQIITDRIIEKLKAGVIPWKNYSNVRVGYPRNLVSKKAYRGMNVFMLAMSGYSSPWWVTFNQAKQLGGTVKKGEKSTPVIFWNFVDSIDKETGEKKRVPFLRYYLVWNVEQTSGLEKHIPAPVKARKVNINKLAKAIIKGMPNPPVIKEGVFSYASYNPKLDIVKMVKQSLTTSDHAYYAVLFHELVHSTGHESRLDRGLQGPADRESYSQEELVAEMGAAFLSAEAGIIQETIDNAASYIAGWLKALKDDPKLLVKAAGKAQRAADYILDREVENAVPVIDKPLPIREVVVSY